MLFAVSGLMGCPVEASDGEVGAVKDFLFDDQTWKIRWMAVEAGDWLPGRRRVFIHPSAIAPLHISPKPTLPMMSSAATLQTERQSGESADRGRPPRSRRRAGDEGHGGAPLRLLRLGSLLGRVAFWRRRLAECGIARLSATRRGASADAEIPPLDGADHLHSVAEFKDYYVHAVDGDIGHVENLLADDANWEIRYLVIATRNWWPGKVVQLSPYAVKDIDWFGEHVNMNVTRDQVQVCSGLGPAGDGRRGQRG